MLRVRRGASLLGLLFLPVFPVRALAGAPFGPSSECQQLSVQPPRYRLDFYIVDTHSWDPLCEVRIEPISWNGFAAEPVLECSGPEPFIASVDSSGTAHFSVDPCIGGWGLIQHLRLVVATVPVWFMGRLLTGGVRDDASLFDFPCTTVVPAVRHSWGSLKELYR